MSAVPDHYRRDIDGLRALAVLAVVFHHLSYDLAPGGYVGVDVFFVISGYLITGIIRRELDEGRFSFWRFYERRVRRIFPALFAVLGATLAAGYFLLLPSDYLATFKASLATIFFSSNILFWQDLVAGYFAADAKLNPLLHTWSLAVEEQFYLGFPLLMWLCWRHLRGLVIPVLAALAALSLLLASIWVEDHSVAVFFLTPFRGWELLVGALLALRGPGTGPGHRWGREGLSVAGLLGLVVPVFAYDTATDFPGMSALPPVLGTALLIHAGRWTTAPTVVTRLLQWRPLVYVGLISYSLYLWHWPVIVLARFALKMAPITPYIPLLLVASLALASLSYHFVEQPFRRVARGHGTRRVFAGAGAVAALLAAVSLFGAYRHGMPERIPARALTMDQARHETVSGAVRACQRRLASSTGDWCRMGPADRSSSVMLWGDSHLMAWMPTLEHVFSESAPWTATLVPNSACPPIFGVENLTYGGCHAVGQAVRRHLRDNPGIRSVLLFARWGTYLDADGGYAVVDGTVPENVGGAFQATIDWLVDRGIRVVLVGPVPEYPASVPLLLALDGPSSPGSITQSYDRTRVANPTFYAVTERNAVPGSMISLVDPATWICNPDCVVQRDWVPYYRDAHHLSAAGALAYRRQFEASLRQALGP